MPTMHAMRCEAPGRPLEPGTFALPAPGPGELLVEVRACGVCRTDLHLVDGELANARLPVIPGHEIVGTMVASGPGVSGPAPGSRVGGPWLGGACGRCAYCREDRENLCDLPVFTGYHRDGGFAERALTEATAKDLEELKSRKGELRQIAMELLYRVGGLRGPEIGEIFGVGYTSVSQERRRLRERILHDRRLQEVVDRIERKLSTMKI